MKLSIQTKLILSYAVIIFVTLTLLSVMTEYFVSQHFQAFLGGPNFKDHQVNNTSFIDDVKRSIIFTAAGAGAFAILISFLVAKYITAPLKHLTAATKAIAKGRYQRAEIETFDEVGELTHSFNELADTLDENHELQKQLITNVSHELATPLTNINGYLEALNDGVIKQDRRQKTYKLMKEEVDRLTHMLGDILALSLIEKDSFKIQKAPTQVAAAIEYVIKQMQTSADKKRIKFELLNSLTQKTADLDKNRFIQILMNLLGNAIQYSHEGGTIQIKAENKGEELSVAIMDSGAGIPKEELRHIFERFYRTDKARSRNGSGIGVGLSIVKELVEAHNGQIHATSESGHGSIFECIFPQ